MSQWNANGLKKHTAELKNLLTSKSGLYDIICIQETFLKPVSSYNIQGYVTIRRDRLDAAKGGLITLIKESIKYTREIDLTDVEALVITVKTNSGYITVSNVYISPNQTIEIGKLKPLFINTQNVITGDLNAKSNLWGSPVSNHRGVMIESLLEEYDYSVLNTGKPTFQKFAGAMSHIVVNTSKQSYSK